MKKIYFIFLFVFPLIVFSQASKYHYIPPLTSAEGNADDMSAIAKAWKMQMNYISNMKKETFALKVGDKVNWTYRGFTKEGTVQKVNRTTVDVVATGATPFGRTVTRVPMSMLGE